MSTAPVTAIPLDPDECTIGDYIANLAPSIWQAEGGPTVPDWPPDMFAIVASLLNITGSYCNVVRTEAIHVNWSSENDPTSWPEEMKQIGQDWREGYSTRLQKGEVACPPLVAQWWEIVLTCAALPLCACAGRHLDDNVERPDDADAADVDETYWSLCSALFNLLAASDEACAGVGFPELTVAGARDDVTRIRLMAWFLEHDTIRDANRDSHYGSTLCKAVHPSRVRVLPKLHTPRTGMTLRSLSLHLALCPADEAKITWENASGWRRSVEQQLNLLVVPWPMEIRPRDIAVVREGLDGNAHPSHNLFAYDPGEAEIKHKGNTISELVEDLVRQAVHIIGDGGIHGVVLPETAVTHDEYELIKGVADKYELLVIAGIRTKSKKGNRRNQMNLYVPFADSEASGSELTKRGLKEFEQFKHHRWFLDADQIARYGLASRLHPDAGWWEGIEIVPRSLRCVALRDWLYVCALICEDLARQDPMATAVRAIGPSLLVALLMDGPQLATRWPSRYATVLADDPGTSVLTVTSLGMVKLSYAMRPSTEYKVRRTIASWKDSQTGLVEIDLPPDADGAILCLSSKQSLERSADGRTDHRKESLIVLGGVHYVTCSTKDATS